MTTASSFRSRSCVGSLEAGYAPGGGDELAGGRRRIGDADELEEVAERDQVRNVLDLRNGAGADDADAEFGHAMPLMLSP